MTNRVYRLNKRAEGMAETRRRILEAARELFLAGNFHEVSMEKVAQRAGVGRTTVFQQFESKVGLLRALEEDVSQRAGIEKLLQGLRLDDAAQALRAAFEVGGTIWEAERPMFRKLFSFATLDEEMGTVMREKEDVRGQLVRDLVKGLQRQKRLRPGVTARKAEDVLWLLTGFESFDALYERCGSGAAVGRMLLEIAGGFVVVE